jgi:hypothetical protein
MFVGYTITEGHGKVAEGIGMTIGLLPLVYLFLLVPAIGLAYADKLLEDSKWRLIGVCLIAVLIVPIIFAQGAPAWKWLGLGFAGLVPTALCSLLTMSVNRRNLGRRIK